MNFWKRLKNWRNYLIHWLGGYSEAEYKAAELRAEKLRDECEALDAKCAFLRSKIEDIYRITRG